MTSPDIIEIIVAGARYRSAAEVASRRPEARNIRLDGKMWIADVPGEGSGLTVGRLPDELLPEQVPEDQRQHPGLNTGFDNYGLTKQGSFYDADGGLISLPGLGLVNIGPLARWLPWIAGGLLLAAVVAAGRRKGR